MSVQIKNLKQNIVFCEKYYIWNQATRTYENGKYLASIIKDSVIQNTNNFP